MDKKAIKLVKKAVKGHEGALENFRIKRRWNNVAAYVDDWDEVRDYINDNLSIPNRPDPLQAFAEACTRYIDKINSQPQPAPAPEQTNEGSELANDLKQGAKAVLGAAVIGGIAGYRYDTSKRWGQRKK